MVVSCQARHSALGKMVDTRISGPGRWPKFSCSNRSTRNGTASASNVNNPFSFMPRPSSPYGPGGPCAAGRRR